jgi:uncharacterized protein YxjI
VEAFFDGRSGIGVHQRRKVFELRNQYTLTNEDGTPAGAIEQSKQTPFAFIARLLSDLDAMLPTTLEVTDTTGATVLTLRKPWFTTRVAVIGPNGEDLGEIRRRIRIGKPVYEITQGGTVIGSLRGEDWRSRHFSIQDGADREFARVTKKWRGLFTEAFTDADSYAVEFLDFASTQQRALALAGALSVDLIQKQKDAGGGLGAFTN